MSEIKLRFMCGHLVPWKEGTKPVCPECGETRRRQVIARPPTFRGSVHGPLAQTVPVAPLAMRLATEE